VAIGVSVIKVALQQIFVGANCKKAIVFLPSYERLAPSPRW
jgi:hypothetical protein